MRERKRVKRSRTAVITLVFLSGLVAVAAILFILARPAVPVRAALSTGPVSAPTADLTVCPAGPPTCDYASVQDAVDAANDGDVIKVATGIYTDVNVCPRNDITTTGVVTQVVYISKTVTVRGGYTTANWTTSYPLTQPTTLDALGQGRVLYITGDISLTIEGLRITGGDAKDLDGGPHYSPDAGGGVYVTSATVRFNDCTVLSNTAKRGGGLYIAHSPAMLSGITVISNTAQFGGGLELYDSPAALSRLTLTGNIATGGGGGLMIGDSDDATLNDSLIFNNTALAHGGGVYVVASAVTLSGNTILSNTATNEGGGVYVVGSAATLNGNVISGNRADRAGGGVAVIEGSAVSLASNTIITNTAGNSGGGVHLWDTDVTLTNNIVADNWTDGNGIEVFIGGSEAHLFHNTLTRSGGGEGSAVFVISSFDYHSNAWLTNTIVTSHTIGIEVAPGSPTVLNGVLWFGNGDNIRNILELASITVTNEITGNPAFVAPGVGDYHIGTGSAAIDAGVNAGVTVDIDGEPRPAGEGYDLGADEFPAALRVTKQATPDPAQAGEQLTYTIRVTNTGNVDLHATIIDTLPAHVIPTGILTWTPTITAPGGVWTETVIVTVEEDYEGPLTNLVEVTTEEGATGNACVIVNPYKVYLPLVMRQYQ